MTTMSETTRERTPPDTEAYSLGPSKTNVALPQPRILLADDNGQMCLLLAVYLQEAGYDVVQCYDGYQLVEHLGSYLLPSSAETYDLIISDIRMPDLSGLEVLEGLGDRDDFPPMILITAFGNAKTHERARELGAAAVFDKPFSVEDLIGKVRELVPIEKPPRTT